MDDLVAIAKIVRPRGLRGEVVAEVLTDFPARFEELESVIGVFADGSRKDLKIENSWFQKDRIVFKFAGVDSVETGEELRNTEICIPETDAVELDQGEFFEWQLHDCTVITNDGEHLGTVRELMRTGGTENLVVENAGKEYLIPFAEAICTEVDVENKRIVVELPEGLLDF